MTSRGWLVVAVALVGALLTAPAYAEPERELPPAGVEFDYQLGGSRPVPEPVGIVVRDRSAAPEDGLYNVCYVNGFQTQQSQRKFWHRRWDLILKRDGVPVEDASWGEWLLDVRTAAKRRKLTRIVGRWIEGCADDGFDAVELDNLDSFTRSRRLITRRDTLRFAGTLVVRAHRAGLAVAQKNLAGWDGRRTGFDFAISEDCARWRECSSYVDHYGELVLDVEYRKKAFKRACRRWDDTIAVVRRDLALSETGTRRWCPTP